MGPTFAKRDNFDRLETDHRKMTAQVAALTAVVGGVTSLGVVNFDRLEDCVTFALKQVRPSARPLFLARASELLGDLEKLQVALAVEKRKARGFKLKRK